MYEACVERIKVFPHPNADRLNVGKVCGETTIIGKETEDDELVIYFPCDGRLSEAFLAGNDLFSRIDEETGKKAGGFFGKEGRVRAQNFRGVRSEGFVCSLDMLVKGGVDEDVVASLKEGDRFTSLGGVAVCEKYETPATIASQKGGTPKGERFKLNTFKEHKNTKHVLRELSRIKIPCLVTATVKLHGTSARYGCVPVRKKIKNGFWRRLFRKPELDFTDYELVMGSRRVTIDPEDPEDGFHGSNKFRADIFKRFAHLLKSGEVVYGEIVGYTSLGRPIMGKYSTSKMPKEFQEQHGEEVVFNYGCPDGQCEFYVYRITHVNEEGDELDVPWVQVMKRAKELGLKHVEQFYWPIFCSNGGAQGLDGPISSDVEAIERVKRFEEGLVFRVDSEDGADFYKYKTFDFRLLEGILKEDPRYVDMEESS